MRSACVLFALLLAESTPPTAAAQQGACPMDSLGDSATVFRIRMRGAALAKSGRYVESLACYQEVLRREPNDGASHMNSGMMLEILKRYPESEREYELALPLTPNAIGRQHILWHLGYTNAQLGQYQTALLWFQQAGDANPADGSSWANAAVAAGRVGQDSLARVYKARADSLRSVRP